MATFVFTDASVTINSVDLSDHVRSVTLDITAEEQDDTAMGATFRSRKGGLKEGSLSLEFNSDFAAAGIGVIVRLNNSFNSPNGAIAGGTVSTTGV